MTINRYRVLYNDGEHWLDGHTGEGWYVVFINDCNIDEKETWTVVGSVYHNDRDAERESAARNRQLGSNYM